MNRQEWEYVKRRYEYSCAVCGICEDTSGVPLEKSHLFAKSKGGATIVPMCPNCHTKFNAGLSDGLELSKLGMSRSEYKASLPAGRSIPSEGLSGNGSFDPFDVSDAQGQIRDILS